MHGGGALGESFRRSGCSANAQELFLDKDVGM